jgi:hypothetical protein
MVKGSRVETRVCAKFQQNIHAHVVCPCPLPRPTIRAHVFLPFSSFLLLQVQEEQLTI